MSIESIFENVPSLSQIPQNVLLALIVVGAVLVLLFILFLITDVVSTEAKEHRMPDSHKLIMDLQKTMVKEMRGTSTQNWIMIILTIIFISVSVLGGGVFLGMFDKLGSLATSYFPQLIDQIKALIGR